MINIKDSITRLDLKIWIPSILSILVYAVSSAKVNEMTSCVNQASGIQTCITPYPYSLFWYVCFFLQLIAALYAYKLLKIKHRSRAYSALVLIFGLAGVIVVYFLSDKTIEIKPTAQN